MAKILTKAGGILRAKTVPAKSALRFFALGASFLLLALAALHARAAELSVSPVAIELTRAIERSTITVVNQGRDPVVMQADSVGWVRENGVDKDVASTDLLVNPPVFTIQPGQSQIVRLGMRAKPTGEKQQTYRVVMREVPSAYTPEGAGAQGNIRVLVALRIPVYVLPDNVIRAEKWTGKIAKDGTVTTSVKNSGNVYMKVGSIQLRPADSKDPVDPAAAKSFGIVVFPGEDKSFSIKPAYAVAPGAATLQLVTDRGPEQVAVDLSKE